MQFSATDFFGKKYSVNKALKYMHTATEAREIKLRFQILLAFLLFIFVTISALKDLGFFYNPWQLPFAG